MAISSSVVIKAGAAGTIVAGTGLGGTYLAWDHITLYSVERKVISKDLRLTVSQTPDTKKIKVSAPKSSGLAEGTNSELGSGETWTCEITVKPKDGDTTSYTNLGKYIQSNLQISNQIIDDTQRHNKKLLVKACAQKRTRDESNETVNGSLTLVWDESKSNKFTFEDHAYLDFLLENALYEVEKKVIEEKVGFSISETGSSPSKVITIKTVEKSGVWGENDANKNYWECKITGNSKTSTFSASEVKKLLPENETSEQHKSNKEHLVRLCSKSRTTTSSTTKPKSEFTLPSDLEDANWKTYLFGVAK